MSTSVIDWNLARSVAHRVGGNGPTIGREGAQRAVEELRVGADTAVHVVRDITGLSADARPDSVRVVDRSRWVDANAASFASVLEPLTQRMRRDSATGAIGSRLAGAEIGAALGFLSARVLGQYELFTAPDADSAAAPGGTERRRRRTATRRPPVRLSAVGLPARGDPSRAVHCGPVARPMAARADPVDHQRPLGRASRPGTPHYVRSWPRSSARFVASTS